MTNYTVEIEKRAKNHKVTKMIVTLEEAEKLLTKKQYEDLMEMGYMFRPTITATLKH
jgi:hypothetical protein